MSAHNTIDRTGEVYNHWTIVSYSHTNKYKKRMYLCRCRCGFEKVLRVNRIVRGLSISCGCLINRPYRNYGSFGKHENHGMSGTKVYRTWVRINQRCTMEYDISWKHYGGRGITVCERWKNSFLNFFNDMGHPPSLKHSIDRIDVNGNYEPNNCRWATAKQQSNNKRKGILNPQHN